MNRRRAVLLTGGGVLTLIAAILIATWPDWLRNLRQIINPGNGNGDETAPDVASEATTRIANAIVRAHDAARRTRTDRDFVLTFNAQLDRAMQRKPVDKPGDATAEYYANARDLLDLSADDARDVARGVRAHFNTWALRGRHTMATEHPDCVAVGTPTSWLCSGTLIGPNTVVTAGHCFEKAKARGELLTRVFFGHDMNDATTGRTVSVTKRLPIHPGYVTEGEHNDIGVLLIEPVKTVPAAGIARGSEVDSSKWVREVGFGKVTLNGPYSGKRQLLEVPIASRDCSFPAPQVYVCNTSLELVAKPATTQPAGVCHGDSGGPAYVLSGASWRVAGITSRPAKNVDLPCGGAAIFIRLDRYERWLRSNPEIILQP